MYIYRLRNRVGRNFIQLIFLMLFMAAPASVCHGEAANWYKGNTHCHTTRSDGDTSPAKAAEWYHDNGYHFIHFTDHNLWWPSEEARFEPERSDFLMISGEEINNGFTWDRNHVTAFNTDGPTGKFQSEPKSQLEYIQMQIDLVHERNGIPFINHPTWSRPVIADTILRLQGIEHFELFNGCQDTDNFGIYTTQFPSTEGIWDQVLSGGAKLYGIAADDAHDFRHFPSDCNPGTSWIMVRAEELTTSSIRKAIADGDFYATNGVILKSYTTENGLYSVEVDTAATLKEISRKDDLKIINTGKPLKGEKEGFLIEFIGQDGNVIKTTSRIKTSMQLTRSMPYLRSRISYVRAITKNSSPYSKSLKQKQYIKSRGMNQEAYYAWGQPIFSDKRGKSEHLALFIIQK